MRRKDSLSRQIFYVAIAMVFTLGCVFGYCQTADPASPPPTGQPDKPVSLGRMEIKLPTGHPKEFVVVGPSRPMSIVQVQVNYDHWRPTVAGVPYSGVETDTYTMSDSDGKKFETRTIVRHFRDSQGRTRNETTTIPGNSTETSRPVDFIMIDDPVRREHYLLRPQQKTVDVYQWHDVKRTSPPVTPPTPSTLMGLPKGYFPGAPDAEAKEAVSLGEKMIDGIKVLGTRVEHVIPAGNLGSDKPVTITAEQWFSPELGAVIQATQRSSMGNQNTRRLEQIVRAEPDAALFSVPTDYSRRESPQSSAASRATR